MKLIQKKLKENGQKINWFAKKVGVKRLAVSDWFQGKYVPTEKNKIRILKVLNITNDNEKLDWEESRKEYLAKKRAEGYKTKKASVKKRLVTGLIDE